MVLDVRGPLWGPRFRALLEELVPHAAFAGMTSTAFRHRGDWLSRADDHLIGTRKVREWPGTVSLVPVRHYTFAYSAMFIELLLAQCHNPYRLQERAMPDNLHVLSSSGRVLLGTNSCDRSAWTQLTAEEWSGLVRARDLLSSLSVAESVHALAKRDDGRPWPGWSDPWLPGAPVP